MKQWFNVTVYNRKTKLDEVVRVEIEVEFYRIARNLAQKAFENKSKKSKEADGAVTLKILENL